MSKDAFGPVDRRTFMAGAVAAAATASAAAQEAASAPSPAQETVPQMAPARSFTSGSVTGVVRCNGQNGGIIAGLNGVPVTANDSYGGTSASTGAYTLSVPAYDYYDLLADPSDHRWEIHMSVWVPLSKTKDFSCSHLTGAYPQAFAENQA